MLKILPGRHQNFLVNPGRSRLFQKQKKPQRSMIFGIIANTQIPRIWDVLPDFLVWLKSKGAQIIVCEDLRDHLKDSKLNFLPPDKLAAKSNMVLSFGGDGTLLSTARKIGRSQTPIMGVNLGGLGYLAEISLGSLQPRIEELLSGSYRVEDRMVLRCRVEGKPDEYFALNDIIIGKGAAHRVVNIRTTIGGRYLNTYTGDGLIVATPTGSTAYSLSSGGPIVEPSLGALIVNPIAPHTLADRPIVIGGDKEIEALVEGSPNELTLVADGQVKCQLGPGDRVLIQRADFVTKLALFHDKYFYDVLREKLKWGDSPYKRTTSE
ncbi:NAD(+) kinase [candidate division LCP-89 bacterium B3_LCP]|uniref:NAD kinase n=1 Tax=candidate division LCP-89 bacterium B3_LCP TaxID=2012998 RepID=A0A532V261_UNCL8|nr:MAG: NAD(+) kinase [candidate division LCP-89 bacterium B3_LCP]